MGGARKRREPRFSDVFQNSAECRCTHRATVARLPSARRFRAKGGVNHRIFLHAHRSCLGVEAPLADRARIGCRIDAPVAFGSLSMNPALQATAEGLDEGRGSAVLSFSPVIMRISREVRGTAAMERRRGSLNAPCASMSWEAAAAHSRDLRRKSLIRSEGCLYFHSL